MVQNPASLRGGFVLIISCHRKYKTNHWKIEIKSCILPPIRKPILGDKMYGNNEGGGLYSTERDKFRIQNISYMRRRIRTAHAQSKQGVVAERIQSIIHSKPWLDIFRGRGLMVRRWFSAPKIAGSSPVGLGVFFFSRFLYYSYTLD